MQKPPFDPDVADVAPTASVLCGYDEQHLVTYLRLLGAAAEGPIGKRSPASCCASIRSASPIGRGACGGHSVGCQINNAKVERTENAADHAAALA